MAKNTDQAFESIRIVGGLLSTKVLQDARRYQLPGQGKEDYQIEPGLSFNEEIGRYWRIAQGRWQEYQQKIEREDIDGSELAQEEWLLPLLQRVLGYEIVTSSRKTIGEREFPISHFAHLNNEGQGAVPLVLCGAEYELDKGDIHFGQEGRKRSPMGLAQEYLNAENACLWAVVSNGRYLRLLRDNPAMTRPAYVEVDFSRLFDEDNYADFATLWLLLQASRLAPQDGQAEQCWLEQWRNKGHDEGERALEKLRYGVADALRQLGTGFVAHKANMDLRDKISSGELTTDEYFQQVLRLVYRFLFMLTAEDRDVLLLPQEHEGKDYTTARKLYQRGYSIANLRDRARLNRHYDHHGDGWQQLLISFSGFAQGQPLLAQPALGGLFADGQCADLANAELENSYLFSALFNLSYFEHNQTLSRINYRDMDTEEFGSVYESLLELIPQLSTEGQWTFSFMGDAEDEESASGHSRKLTGSYYTPDSLVQELIKSALVPVIEERLKQNPQQPRDAILSITICDPACGSGHFLLAAARRLAIELAKIDAGTDQPTEAHYRHAIRDIVRHCIYGVDLNPMAVELCKTGLWLESIEPGKPLSFLDAHVQNGNALIGCKHPSEVESGIHSLAYKPFTSDEKSVCNQLKKQNKDVEEYLQLGLLRGGKAPEAESYSAYKDDLPEDSLEQVEAKKSSWVNYVNDELIVSERSIEDIYTSAIFFRKTVENYDLIPTDVLIHEYSQDNSLHKTTNEHARLISQNMRFFHWSTRFPEVFSSDNPGFSVVLGNPPWEILEFNEKEFFSIYAPEINGLKGKTKSQAVRRLFDSSPWLERLMKERREKMDRVRAYVQSLARYENSSVGRINTYPLFVDLGMNIIESNGVCAQIVPSAIAMDAYNEKLFKSILLGGKLKSFIDFENSKGLFKSVHKSYRFCLIVIGGGNETDEAKMGYMFKSASELDHPGRIIDVPFSDFEYLSPGTSSPTVFFTNQDYSLSKKIYQLIYSFSGASSFDDGLEFSVKRMLSKSDKGVEFYPKEELTKIGEKERLYTGKNIHHYNHRYASYDEAWKTSPDSSLISSDYTVETEYYVESNEVQSRISDKFPNRWLVGYRDVCRSNDERTAICAIIPKSGCDTHCRNIYFSTADPAYIACFVANFNSLVLDFCARQKITGIGLGAGVVSQLPLLKFGQYSEVDIDFIYTRVLELTYVSMDIKLFAEDLGYQGTPFAYDSKRRHQLRCELDAYYAKLYGLTREELRYILDPSDVMGDDYPSETFRVLKNKETKIYGEYRTQRLVLDAWDRLTVSETTGEPYQSIANPPPGENIQPPTSSLFASESDALFAGFIYSYIKQNGQVSFNDILMMLGVLSLGDKIGALLSDDHKANLPDLVRMSDSVSDISKLIKVLEGNCLRVIRNGNNLTYHTEGEPLQGLILGKHVERLAEVMKVTTQRWKNSLPNIDVDNLNARDRKVL